MKVITIGRSSSNDVVIHDDKVSRHHLHIVQYDNGAYTLTDYDSTNGTYVNGGQVTGKENLNSSDVIRIGRTTLPWMDYFQGENTVNQQRGCLWLKAVEFEEFMKEQDFRSFDDLTFVLQRLPLLKIRKGYVFDAFKEGIENFGWNYRPYCHKEGSRKIFKYGKVKEEQISTNKLSSLFRKIGKTKMLRKIKRLLGRSYRDNLVIKDTIHWDNAKDMPPVLPYFIVPFTEEGIMQAWLLDNISDFMPKYWHANYETKYFVFNPYHIVRKIPKDVTEQIKNLNLDSMFFRVNKINDNKAVVVYTYWNDWKGLVKVRTMVTKTKESIQFHEPERNTLVEYHSNTMF